MRLTPAQGAMCWLLGERLPMGTPDEWSLVDIIRGGHELLVDIAKVDLGYDPQKWHDHLRATNAGGYRWSNKHLGFPKQIAEALANEEWRVVVEQLSRPAAARPLPYTRRRARVPACSRLSPRSQ